MLWCFLFFASLAGALMLVGHYERRVRALETNPRERIRIVPRSYYDEQTGADFQSGSGPAQEYAPVQT